MTAAVNVASCVTDDGYPFSRQFAMLIRVAIACVVVFLGSCLIARQIALRKNHRPEVIIIAGIIVGAICFGLLWTLSLVYGGGYTKIAAGALLSVMPAVAAWIVPPREER